MSGVIRGLRQRARTLLGDPVTDWLVERRFDLSSLAQRVASPEYRRQINYLDQFRDKHRGERCVIIGNGPSLQNTDMSLLREEITFGLNRIYLMFDELGFQTTYYVCINQLVIDQVHDEIETLEMPKFIRWSSREFFERSRTTGLLRSRPGLDFARDIRHGLWEGATVTYAALQLAYFMGFEQAVLVGVDHNFVTKGPAHEVVTSEGADPNHFHPGYFGKGFRWQLPDLETSEIAYGLARQAYENDGRTVLDASVDGKLKIFDKVDLEDALR